MAARFIDKQASVTTSTAKNLPDAAGVQYDTNDGFIKYNDAGTIRTVVNTDEAQTLTNKTLTSPTITGIVGSTGTLSTESVTAANVIAASESGTTYFLNLAGGFASTLPAPAAGLHFRFIVGTAPTTSYTITTNASANVIFGQVYCNAGTDEDSATTGGEDTISFVANTAVVGDQVDIVSDGTKWYFKGFCNATGGITITTAT